MARVRECVNGEGQRVCLGTRSRPKGLHEASGRRADHFLEEDPSFGRVGRLFVILKVLPDSALFQLHVSQSLFHSLVQLHVFTITVSQLGSVTRFHNHCFT